MTKHSTHIWANLLVTYLTASLRQRAPALIAVAGEPRQSSSVSMS